jgi:hypothetical protein
VLRRRKPASRLQAFSWTADVALPLLFLALLLHVLIASVFWILEVVV